MVTDGLSIMLRTYFVQQWFNLSDPGMEEALYESAALRRFVGVDLGVAPAPDETTICRFRHLLEKRSGRSDAGCGERASGCQGHPHCDRHNRRCDHHPRAFDLDGSRCIGGMNSVQALVWNVRTSFWMARETTNGKHHEKEYRCQDERRSCPE
jgi:Transposase domain (DUF772)